MQRLQKYIAHSGYCSRRKAEEYIKDGKVLVDGKVAKIGMKVKGNEYITINGEELKIEEKEYYLLNKPLGVVTTAKDQFKRNNVVDLIDTDKRIVPAGRLDMYTTGALILTNDGDLIYNITHPKHEVTKTYYVTVRGSNAGVLEKALKKLEQGVIIDGKKTSECETEIMGVFQKENKSKFKIIIHEGMNRQVRKMCEVVDLKVLALHRAKIADIDLKGLKIGEYRKLKDKEVQKLLNI